MDFTCSSISSRTFGQIIDDVVSGNDTFAALAPLFQQLDTLITTASQRGDVHNMPIEYEGADLIREKFYDCF